VEETSQYAIWRRLKHEETRQVPPPRPENIKTAVQQITADCIILYMMKVRQLLDERGFPDAVVPRGAALGGPAAPAAVANAAAPPAAVANAAAAPPVAPVAPAANGEGGIALRHLFNANQNAAANAAPAANAAQLPVLYPADNTLVARPRIRQGLADPPREREGPLDHMFTWVLETDVTFGDGIDDVLFSVSEDVKQSQVYRSWKEANDAIRAGGIVPNNYDQLWAAVCVKYVEVYLAQVAVVQQGGRSKSNKSRTYKRSTKRHNRKTYKQRKIKSHAYKTNVV
jgi:hypothetical protein